MASFSQWFALSVAIGVVSYVLVPFIRDIAAAADWAGAAAALDTGPVRLTISLGVLWAAVGANLRGIRFYERLVIPLMFLTFLLGFVVIAAGFLFDQGDFAAALVDREWRAVPEVESAFALWPFVSASAVLFASFIGFDAIAQVGGEARGRRPHAGLREEHRRVGGGGPRARRALRRHPAGEHARQRGARGRAVPGGDRSRRRTGR